MADYTKSYSGNSASRGNLTFHIGETLSATKAYQNGIEGYNVTVSRYLWCSMSTSGVAVSGSVCNGYSSVSAGNNGTTNIINNVWYKAGTSVSIGSCSVSIKLNSITATSSLSAQTYSLPAPTYAVISSVSGNSMIAGENNTITINFTPNTTTQEFLYGVTYTDSNNTVHTLAAITDRFLPATTSSQSVQLTFPNNTLAELNINATSFQLSAYVTTYANSTATTAVGTSTAAVTVSMGANSGYGPTITKVQTILSNKDNQYGYKDCYAGYSSITLVTTGANVGVAGATFTSATVSYSSNTFTSVSETVLTSAGFPIGTINAVGNVTFTFTITNSRGLSTSANTEALSVVEYAPLQISGFNISRCDSDGTDNTQGNSAHAYGIINRTTGTAIGLSIIVTEYGKTTIIDSFPAGATADTLINTTVPDNLSSIKLGNSALSTDVNYTYTVTVGDGIGANYTVSTAITGSYAIIEVLESKKSIGFLGATELAADDEFRIGPTKAEGEDGKIKLILNGTDVQAEIDDIDDKVDTKQDQLTAGTGIDITDNTVSCTVAGFPGWQRLCWGGSSSGTTYTVASLSQFQEVLIACGESSSTSSARRDRVLASTVVPIKALLQYSTGDISDGAHQTYYTSTYRAGISYISDTQIKVYKSDSAYCTVWAR